MAVPVRHKEQVQIIAQKTTFTPRDKSVIPCVKSEVYSYPKCVMDWARMTYRNLFKDNNSTGTKKRFFGIFPFPHCKYLKAVGTLEDNSWLSGQAFLLAKTGRRTRMPETRHTARCLNS